MLIFFCFIGAFLLNTVTCVLIPSWTYTMEGQDAGEGTRYRDFYKQQNNSIDYLVLGTSHTNYSINPMQIYEETGYTGYVLGGEKQLMSCSYYWLREACRTQQPKAVFVDVSALISETDDGSLVLKELLAMKPSLNKLHAIIDTSPDKDTFYSAFFPLYSFHERWKELNISDYKGVDESRYYLRGSALRFLSSDKYLSPEVGFRNREYISIDADGNDSASEEALSVNPDAAEYFEKIVSFCSENDIRLVPVKCPTRRWNSDYSDAVSAYLSEVGAEALLDMNAQDELVFNWSTDTFDDGYHLSYIGNSKASHWFASYLDSMGIFTDHRETDGTWNDDAEKYLSWERDNIYDRLYPGQSIYRYLETIANNTDKYVVMVSVYHDASAFYDEEMDTLFKRIGFENGLMPEEQKALLGYTDSGEKVLLRSSYKKEEYDGSFTSNDGIDHEFTMISSGAASGKESSIYVDDREYSFDSPGINMVVIDKADGKVISGANFGCDDDGELSFDGKAPDSTSAERWDEVRGADTEAVEKTVLTISGNDIGLRPVSSENGCYILKDQKSGMVLTPDSFGSTDDTEVMLREFSGVAAQQWTIFTDDDGNYHILSLFADKYLAVNDDGRFVLRTSFGDESRRIMVQHTEGKE